MAGSNTTGLPQTKDYSLGRGTLYIAKLNTSTGLPNADGYRDVGNVPDFSISINIEELLHQSSRQGLKVTDKRVVTSQTMNISLSLDELSSENMALFFSGDTLESVTNPAVAGFSSVALTTDVALGRWYDIVNGSGVRCVDLDASKVAVKGGASGTTALTEGADYTLDLKMGRIFTLAVPATLIAGDNLNVVLTADAGAAATLDQVLSLTKSSEQLVLKFISENPANDDEQVEFQFHSATLSAEGDFSLIGDDWTKMQLKGVAQQESVATGTARTLTITTHANA
jgi:hypothetical protein